jgi:hypothetical protein
MRLAAPTCCTLDDGIVELVTACDGSRSCRGPQVKNHATKTVLFAPLLAWAVVGCSAANEDGETSNAAGAPAPSGAAAGASATGGEFSTGGTSAEVATGGTPSTGGTAVGGTPATGGASTGGRGGTPATGGASTGGSATRGTGGTPATGGTSTGGSATRGTGGTPATGGASTGGSPAGPEDGDPDAPVSIPEVACGGPVGSVWTAPPSYQIDGRNLVVTYPCNKGAGAPMTFFLNLHGTTPVEQHLYIYDYFSIDSYAESHNMIVVTPSSVVEQWGNGDDGLDEPHLMAVIDWVYETFDGEGKFDIRGMWVGGHSWGAMYASTFACKEELAARVVGAFPMSGMGRQLTCADRISVISSAAEDDIGPVIDQGDVPASNGCGAPVESQIGENVETLWGDCNPGFVYATYFMLGKDHSSPIDDIVVERIADLIKGARR